MLDEGLIITLHERHGRIAWVNQTIPPTTREQIVGSWPWEWLEGADREAAKSAFARCIAIEEPQTLEVTALIAGAPHRLHIRVDPIGGSTFPIIAITRLLDSRTSLLSNREKQVARLTAEGLTAKQIAGRLGIKASTIDTHRCRIRQKLGMDTIAEIALFAMRNLGDSKEP